MAKESIEKLKKALKEKIEEWLKTQGKDATEKGIEETIKVGEIRICNSVEQNKPVKFDSTSNILDLGYFDFSSYVAQAKNFTAQSTDTYDYFCATIPMEICKGDFSVIFKNQYIAIATNQGKIYKGIKDVFSKIPLHSAGSTSQAHDEIELYGEIDSTTYKACGVKALTKGNQLQITLQKNLTITIDYEKDKTIFFSDHLY